MSKDLLEKLLNQSQTPVNIRSIKNDVLFKTDERQLSSSFEIAVSLGLVPGVSQLNVIGRVPNLAINTEVTIWEQQTVYTYLTADTELFISSSDPGDNQTYFISGMTDDYVLKNGTVTANGQVQVSAGNYFRVFSIANIGTTDNAGDIYLAEADTLTGGVPDMVSKIKARIIVGSNISRQALYTVPAEKSVALVLLSPLAQRGGDVEFTIMIRANGGVFWRVFGADVFQAQVLIASPYGFFVDEKTDIEIRAVSDTNNIRASVAIGGILVDD